MKTIQRTEPLPEQIAKLADELPEKSNRRIIFKMFRSVDESYKWPIRNKFNVTDRAIRQLWNYERLSGEYLMGLELCLFLDERISVIVNNENNW